MRKGLHLGLGILAVVAASTVGIGTVCAQGIGLAGIEARAGFVIPEDPIDNTFLLGVTADLGELRPALHLEGGLDFWTKSYDIGMYDWRFTNIGVLAGVRYDFPVEGTFTPFGFGGLGLHIARASGEFTDPRTGGTQDQSDTEIEFGAHFGAGAEFEMSSGMGLVARFGYNVNGGADYLFVTGGLKFNVGS